MKRVVRNEINQAEREPVDQRALLRWLLLVPGILAVVGVVTTTGRAQEIDLVQPAHDLVDVRAASEAVYPPHGQAVRFDHDAHADLSCNHCHLGAQNSGHARDILTPLMDDCATCHDQVWDTSDGNTGTQACGYCHSGYQALWPTGQGYGAVRHPRFPIIQPQPAVDLSPNLIFDHQQHIQLSAGGHDALDASDADASCVTCHGEASDISLPRESLCLGCHEQQEASLACATCHPTSLDGRLATVFPGDGLTPTVVLRPRDHDQSWDVNHALSAAASGMAAMACFTCHAETDCLACHDGSLSASTIHETGFLAYHQNDARRDSASCGSCHQASSFCVDCHIDVDAIDSSLSSGRPPLNSVFHSSGWLAASGGGEHALASQRNLIECASCHSESSCSTCHVTISPHGPEFLGRCNTLIDVNPGLCSNCHAESAADLGALCP